MEETKQTVPAGSKKKKPVVLIAVIAGLLALLLAIIAVIVIVVLVVAFAKPTVTLNDYVTIEATGYNGHGEADFYFDMEKVMPSGVVRTEDEVIERILTMDYANECAKTKKFKEDHMEYGGNAAIKCINKVFGTNY